MYSVWTYDDASCDDVRVFTGSLDACRDYVDGDPDFYIVAPDGFSVVD